MVLFLASREASQACLTGTFVICDAPCYRKQWTDALLDQIGASCCLQRPAWLEGCRSCTETHTHTHTHIQSLSPSLLSLSLCFVGCSDSGWIGVTTITSSPFPHCSPPNGSLFANFAAIAGAVLEGIIKARRVCGGDGASLRAREEEERRRDVHRHQHPSASSLCVHRRM